MFLRAPALLLALSACAGAAPLDVVELPASPAEVATTAPTASAAALPAEVRAARHLVVQFAGAQRAEKKITRTREEALARAVEARDKARAGAPFPALVAAYSDEPGAAARGGEIGGARAKALPPPLAAALGKLAVGEISEPVESPFGFHVLVRTR